jgi:hypothetical protein
MSWKLLYMLQDQTQCKKEKYKYKIVHAAKSIKKYSLNKCEILNFSFRNLFLIFALAF